MLIKKWKDCCLISEQESYFPEDAVPVKEIFSPLVMLVCDKTVCARGYYAVKTMLEIANNTLTERLLPLSVRDTSSEIEVFVHENGASVLNVAYKNAFNVMDAMMHRKDTGLKATIVGLGDVGGTVLTGLKLLGREFSEIGIYDPYEPMGKRYEMEMNQVLSVDDQTLPEVTICSEKELFNTNVLIFTASRGVPAVGSEIKDVRMAQFEANKQMLDVYAETARKCGYTGYFCQVSDPVDHLAQEVYLRSNQTENGEFDFGGLLPEQVQGFGLGVMYARASYYAKNKKVPFSLGRAYGPHGQGLIIANSFDEAYNDVLSNELTDLTREANMKVRDLGFKPYIAPGLSSAAVSILRMLRGEIHYGAIMLDGVYFGCQTQETKNGQYIIRENIHAVLIERIKKTHQNLKEFWT